MKLLRTASLLQALALTGWGLATPVVQAVDAPTAVDGESVIVIVERCNKYIESAYWFYRDYQWVLAITPTTCARRTQESGTPFIWDELSRDYSNSRYWGNTHGMRHQLICHMAIARDKPQWNLEPWRPDVGYAKTLEAGCNHVVPLPEKAP
ncbi:MULTISPECIES: DUF2599 domain-containing protein [Pseudomonas]|uniref:DUF2599 domain-containing protein n=1 Tax=Pseudomonas TaxID=286 RepID=UPI00215C85B8|nr:MULTISPECIES: DUF2599 domain-containing protein [unclassified Pseudomonas]MCR8931171.1 DUF2599 domain-containing protein [Pseudomonas sp. S11A4]MCR8974780.1 DUF2599 domain-containing protein [Pseudomonas sp. S11P7]